MNANRLTVPGPDWHEQVQEKVLEPDIPIVDPHHHLWRRLELDYLLEDLQNDTQSGHDIRKTVFVECSASYRDSGPEHLKPVGETEFVAEIAEESKEQSKPLIAGIVAHADLTLGASVEEALEAHEGAGRGLFRGIRHALAHSKHPEHMTIVGRSPAGLYENKNFQEGVRTLGRLGYTYESWHFHYQNKEFLEVAASAPETTIILDHFGTPLGVGPYRNEREEIFEQWRKDIAEISVLPNVYAKLGGLSMPDNGFSWHLGDRPPTSDELVGAQKRYYEHTIECFGPDRCMFESNFPVDRLSISYHVLYNAFKKMVSHFSDSEKLEMFNGTASRVYNL